MARNTDVLRDETRHDRRSRVRWLAVATLLGWVLSGPGSGAAARAEQAQAQVDPARRIVVFRGSVQKEPVRKLDLVVGETVQIKTEMAYQAVTVVPEGFVTTQLKGPHEIYVTGTKPGKTEIRLKAADGKMPVFETTVKAEPGRPAGDGVFKASLRIAPVQRFTLHVNKSMLIQTNMPCRRIQALSAAESEDEKAKQSAQDRVAKAAISAINRAAGTKGKGAKDGEEKDKPQDIIQAEAITPTEILVVGKSFGVTQLLLFTEDNKVQIIEITVEADVEQLNEVIKEEVPQAKVRAKSVLGAVVLEGTVPDPETKDRVVDIAKVFVESAKSVKDHIVIRTKAGEPSMEAVMDQVAKLQLRQLNQSIAAMAPSAKIEVAKIHNTYILRGRVPDVETAERVQEIAEIYAAQDPTGQGDVRNHLQVAGVQQVLLRCTVAEVSRQALRQLGVNGWMAGDNVKDMFVVNQLNQINPANIGAAADALVAPPIRGMQAARVPFLTGTEGIPLQPNVPLSIGFPRVQMQLFISALRQNSLLRVLAEPNLMAISGQTATFLVGGEFAYPVPQEGGVPAVEFKEFGVRLAFTPTVLEGQRVRMRIMPEVSQPDDTIGTTIQGTTVPGKSMRTVETVVEIGNGQTLALAGLLDDRIRGVADKIPGLGDVPVLGALFSSVRYQRNQTELLVLCTPELVAPMNPDQVPSVPGEELTSPNDWQLFGLGELEGKKDPPPTAPERALQTVQPIRTYKQPGQTSPDGMNKLSLHGPWGPAESSENY